ncbi:hypothetical protein B0H15DRAFT_796071 [Mycena belliarum]|uniref:Uncharacterized protein n=1 Tax=Mycena belliarum TaxID=1033014 RepID=A0AAD6XWJ5_9AGAR|nr:hypothetical protein B0H15DRAFT_796071 [Mycena belliae]
MAPASKFSPEQRDFLGLWLSEFLAKKANKKLDDFWPRMRAAWVNQWPVELDLGLPLQQIDPIAGPPAPLTTDQKDALAYALGGKFMQLRNWFFNQFGKIRLQRGGVSRSTLSLAALLFKARPKGRRRHQVLEVYQKKYPEKVKGALRLSEYDSLNEATMCRDDEDQWIDDDDDEVKMKRVTETRSKRMKVLRRVVKECWELEPEEVRAAIREAAMNEKLPEPTVEEEGKVFERTAFEYQASIDESMAVAEMFLTEFHKMTGWMGVLVYGGGVPRLQGELGCKTVPFGALPNGLTFEKWHPNFKKSVTNPLFKFLRQAIPQEVRLKRAIYDDDNEEENDGAPTVTGGSPDADEASPTPAPAKKSKRKKKGADDSAASTPTKNAPAQGADKPPRRPQKKRKPVPSGPTASRAGSVARVGDVAVAAHLDEAAGFVSPSDNVPCDYDDHNMYGGGYAADPTNSTTGSVLPRTDVDVHNFLASTNIENFLPNTDGANFLLQNDSALPFLPNSNVGTFSDFNDFLLSNAGPPSFTGTGLDNGTFASTDWTLWPGTQNAGAGEGFSFPAPFTMDEPGTGPTALQFSEAPPQRAPDLSTIGGALEFASAPGIIQHPPSRPRPTPRFAGAVSQEGSAHIFGRPAQYRPINEPQVQCSEASSSPATAVAHSSLSTPKLLPSTPARSSPLSRPPLQAPLTPPRSSIPPASGALPPRLRPSPARGVSSVPRTVPPSPPVFPQSRPMANAPKLPKLVITLEEKAKRMEKARAAKKAGTKKVAVGARGSGEKGEGGTKKAAGGAKASGVTGTRVEPSGYAGSAPPAAASTSRPPVAVPGGVAARPRRTIQAPQNRGEVVSLQERNKALGAQEKGAEVLLEKGGTKRKAVSQENRVPTKRVKTTG